MSIERPWVSARTGPFAAKSRASGRLASASVNRTVTSALMGVRASAGMAKCRV